MNPVVFFDTNVFLHADDADSPAKQKIAIELITRHQRSSTALVSLQVLQEYFASATRKLGVSAGAAQNKVELMAKMRVVLFRESDVISAIELHRLHSISFWDAMIVRAAQLGGASVLYSEDLQAGRTWGDVTVLNPFSENQS